MYTYKDQNYQDTRDGEEVYEVQSTTLVGNSVAKRPRV